MFLGLDTVQAAILAITAIAVATIWGVVNLFPSPRGGHFPSGWEMLQRTHSTRPRERPRHSNRA